MNLNVSHTIFTSPLRRFLVIFLIGPAFLLAGCNSESETNANDSPSSESETSGETATEQSVAVAYDNWTLDFSWPSVDGATYYQVFEDPDGLSGFSQVSPDLAVTEYNLNVSLTERDGARYIVSACNASGCEDFDEISLDTLDTGITAIAVSGDIAPSTGGEVFSSQTGVWLEFDVNDGGTVTILGVTNGTDNSGSAADGIFRYDSSAGLTALQLDDASLRGSNETYNGFMDTRIANNGDIIFSAMLNLDPGAADVDGFNNEVLLRNSAGTTELIAREGEPARGGTEFPVIDNASDVYFTENITANRVFNNISIDGSGGLTFQPGSNTDAFRSADDAIYGGTALWTIEADGTISQSLRPSFSALPGGLTPSVFSGTKRYDQNNAGQLAFGLGLYGASDPATNSGVYVRETSGTFSEKVRTAGGAARDYIDRLQTAFTQITDNGGVFYYTERDVANGNRGLYTNALGTVNTRVARKGLNVLLEDGTTQEVKDFIGGGNSFSTVDDTVAFLVNAGSVNQEDALLVWQNDATTKRFQEGEPVNGLLDSSAVKIDPTLGSTTRRIQINDAGWIGFRGDSSLNKEALFATSPSGYTRLIAREGQVFSVDGTNYGPVDQVLDYKMDAASTMIVSLSFVDDSNGVGNVIYTNGVFSFELCSTNEAC